MELIVIYLLLCLPVGLLAQSYGRSGGGWFLLAIILSPPPAAPAGRAPGGSWTIRKGIDKRNPL